ncbi:hypothetical protein EB061_04920 [bacterium]|nr:hypothetical protein [bacterium]
MKYLRVPKLIRSMSAKEMCSCLFVLKRDFSTCKSDLKMQLPAQPLYFVDRELKTVRTSFLLEGSSTARFQGEHTGCALIP